MSRGLIFFFNKFITAWPLETANLSLFSYTAGVPADPGNAKPIASETHAIVLAVNWPPQDPPDGHATLSSLSKSFVDIFPVECFPTPSKTSTIVTSLPL